MTFKNQHYERVCRHFQGIYPIVFPRPDQHQSDPRDRGPSPSLPSMWSQGKRPPHQAPCQAYPRVRHPTLSFTVSSNPGGNHQNIFGGFARCRLFRFFGMFFHRDYKSKRTIRAEIRSQNTKRLIGYSTSTCYKYKDP